MAPPEISEEAIQLLERVLAEHYINGLPESLAAEVEAVLKSVGRWFRDPQLLYDPEPWE